MNPSPMIQLTGITKVFEGQTRPAVEGLDLEVAEGEFVALVGPSGCGKTTILKMINRIVEPTSGSIQVAGRSVLSVPAHELRRSIGYVIQQIGLFPHKTIHQNIATVPGLLGWDETATDRRVRELTQLVGLDSEMLDRYPGELSGGQQQRVGVARALAADPPVLLMDEPFGAVDPIVRTRLQAELKDLQGRLAKTVVFVTHDIDEALYLGDRVAILNVGGRVEQYATPEQILADPATVFVEDFLGGERGLKRLGLIPIGGQRLDRGPMVDITDSPLRAVEAMDRFGVDWFGVLEGHRILGWADRSDIPAEDLAELTLRELQSTVSSSSSLRDALDAVVTGRNRMAVVVDDGTFRGVLGVEAIAKEITE